MILKRCPLCKDTIKLRKEPSFIYCKNCKSIINNNYNEIPYDIDYFVKDYENQYGKSYIDDFDSIYKKSLQRIEKISSLRKAEKPVSLLDIGSAAGFFLKAAQDSGFENLLGIEISEFAANYCINEYSIPVIQDSFENIHIEQSFDVISAWFFIEHCKEPYNIFKRIYSMLNSGGVFAFSVPSIYGPMYYFNKEEWESTHPQDHLINMTPFTAKKILQSIGFKNVRVNKSGFHPERIVNRDSFFYRPFSRIYEIFTDITGFSDTIEIYATK